MLVFCTLWACTPTSVADAEKKKNVGWLETNGSPEAVAAIGRLADDDKRAQDALEAMSQATVDTLKTDGGAGALDVYLAVWAGVERNASWALAMTKSALSDAKRTNDMASAMKRGASQLGAFVPDLDGAMSQGCGIMCGGVLASIDGVAAAGAIQKRLTDNATRDAMCFGIGTTESSKSARDVFMNAPPTSRDAVQCPGAGGHIAARDDAALAWLATTAEPGLLRSVSEAMPCDRLAKLWAKVIQSRDHATFGALSRSLEDSIKACPKELDATIAGALGTDVDTQTLVLSSLGATNAHELASTCAAAPTAGSRVTSVLARANARDFVARCAK